jgi:hypothetical protein
MGRAPERDACFLRHTSVSVGKRGAAVPVTRRVGRFVVVLAAVATVAGGAGLTATRSWPWQGDSAWHWDLAAAEGNEVAISFTYGDCDRYHGYRVKETPTSVTITVRGRFFDGNCTMGLRGECLRVGLDEPLGDRELRNGRDNRPLLRKGPPPAPERWRPPCDLEVARGGRPAD